MDWVKYVRESCEMQDATEPENYIGMAGAYWQCRYMMNTHVRLSWETCVLDVYRIVLGVSVGFRHQPATFVRGGMTRINNAEDIARQVIMLCEQAAFNNFTPEEFYQYFEELHPCRDGNGRVGSLYFNLYNRTIFDPIHPPPFTKK